MAAFDLFDQRVEALVNPVNCVGVMGRGVARQVRERWPRVFEAYRDACASRWLVPGRILPCRTGSESPEWILNLPTKRHWREPSQLHDVEVGLAALVDAVRSLRIRSVAVPALGCGAGGLCWEAVRPVMEGALGSVRVEGVDVRILPPPPRPTCAPGGRPPSS